jgi:hypothetical protein
MLRLLFVLNLRANKKALRYSLQGAAGNNPKSLDHVRLSNLVIEVYPT